MQSLPDDGPGGITSWTADQLIGALREREGMPGGDRSEPWRLLSELARRADIGVGMDPDLLTTPVIAPWVAQADTRRPAAVLAAYSTDPEMSALLRRLLDDDTDLALVVLTLLHLGDRSFALRAITLAVDPTTDPRTSANLVFEAGRTGDRTLAVPLWNVLLTGPRPLTGAAQTALRTLTGHSPRLPTHADGDGIRSAWAGVDVTAPARPRMGVATLDSKDALVQIDDGRDDFLLTSGLGGPYGGWPSWGIRWVMGGGPVYSAGPPCGTCETYLLRHGWAPATAYALAQRARTAVADVQVLDRTVLGALEALLTGLATGDHHLRLRDTRLHAVRRWEDTWFHTQEDSSSGPLDEPLFVARHADAPREVVVAPTQPASRLDPGTVAAYAAEIEAGARPAVLVAAHAARRHVAIPDEFDDRIERSITGFVLDGHHKLAAYDRTDVPARVVWICDLNRVLGTMGEDPEKIYADLIG